MATGMSVALRNEILDAVFNNGSYAVAVPWISLHTDDPGANGANEATGGSYARQNASAAFAAAGSGACTNDVAVSFTGMPAVTVKYIGVWDDETAGNWLWGGALAANKTTNAGDTFQLPIGDIDASLT